MISLPGLRLKPNLAGQKRNQSVFYFDLAGFVMISLPGLVLKLTKLFYARSLVTTAEQKKAADMIIVVDDLEIINLYHPEKVVDCFREAVENQMQVHKSTQGLSHRYWDFKLGEDIRK